MNHRDLERLPQGELRWTIAQHMIDLRKLDPDDPIPWADIDELYGWPESDSGKGSWNFVGSTIYPDAEGFKR